MFVNEIFIQIRKWNDKQLRLYTRRFGKKYDYISKIFSMDNPEHLENRKSMNSTYHQEEAYSIVKYLDENSSFNADRDDVKSIRVSKVRNNFMLHYYRYFLHLTRLLRLIFKENVVTLSRKDNMNTL